MLERIVTVRRRILNTLCLIEIEYLSKGLILSYIEMKDLNCNAKNNDNKYKYILVQFCRL